MNIEFIKCHGSGNSFVLVGDPRYKFEMEESLLPSFARSICLKKAVASDGLLIVQKDEINNADSHMRMFNPDGSEAEICGNGLRCVARETMEILGTDTAVISTYKKTYKASKENEISSGVYTVSIEMGKPTFDPKKIPINGIMEKVIAEVFPKVFGHLPVSILGMPNPHIVAMIQEEKFPMDLLIKTGELVNNPETRMFPRGGNVNFIKKLSNSEFFVATYERGAGLTPSCGSGMTASSIVVCMLNEAKFFNDITIYNNGGFVKTRVNENPDSDDHEAKLTGNATYILRGKTSYSKTTDVPNSYDAELNLAEVDAYNAILSAKDARLDSIIH